MPSSSTPNPATPKTSICGREHCTACVRADAKNASAVFQALKEFGAPLTDLTPADFAEEGYFYQMGIPPVRVDILMSISGLTFDEAWPRRVKAEFDGVPVLFIARQDLIASKLAAGRPQDLIDAASLVQAKPHVAQPRRQRKKKP
jgi:hypothetical protein